GIIPHPSQQPVDNPRGSPAPFRNLLRSIRRDRDLQDRRAPCYDPDQFGGSIQVEPGDYAETVPERCAEEPLLGCCPDKGKMFEVQFDRACTRPFTDHHIDEKILHCRVQYFLDDRVDPVDLVDEQDIPPFKGGEECSNIPGFLEHRTRRGPNIRPHLAGDDMGKRGLAKPRRTGEQDVVYWFIAFLCGNNSNLQALLDLYLPDKLFQPVWPDGGIVTLFCQGVR